VLDERMAANDPPDLFQANFGEDLLKWGGQSPQIENLKPTADKKGWTFYPEVVKYITSPDGSMYGVPVNIHRINSLFVNKKMLADNGIANPETLEQLHAAADTLIAAGITPMTIGSVNQWTLDMLYLESVFPAVTGGQFYEDYFEGRKEWNDPLITNFLAEAATIWTYMPTEDGFRPNQIDWTDAIDHFITGRVAMTVMGDWAKGLIDADGRMEAGVDYEVIAFPGTVGTYIYTADTFAMPLGAPRRALAIDLLDTMASEEAQVEFNILKGSIPARAIADKSKFDPVTVATINDWNASDKRLALSGLAPGPFFEPIYQALQDFTLSCETTTGCNNAIMLDALQANYDRLKQ
jgi:glucose/mannose transport system substrate-binding protein